MNHHPNPLRDRLSAGRTLLGTAVFSWSANVVEVAGLAGLDFVRLESETAWRRDASMEELVRAAKLAGTVPIIRVDRGDPLIIRKALEIGAGGVMVADIRSVAEAQAVVRAARFPPRGERAYSGNCHSAGWGARAGAAWVEWSDAQTLLGIVVESPEAVAIAEQIVAVDGIDFVQFGAADFAMAIGLGAPDPAEPRVAAAQQRVVAAVQAAGRHLFAAAAPTADAIARQRAAGAAMIELGTDLAALRGVWQAARRAAD